MATPNIPERKYATGQETPPTPEAQAEKISPRETGAEKPMAPKTETQPNPGDTPRFGLSLRRKPSAIPQVRDEITVKIEKIMEEGLGDAFSRLSPVAKQEFKIKGEETAEKIRGLMKHAKTKAKKIFALLLQWLKLLPGVNRFFLEQEAKIKTDRIISLQKNAEQNTIL